MVWQFQTAGDKVGGAPAIYRIRGKAYMALARERLLRGERPVAGALLEVAGRRRLVTGQDGGFELRGDRSLPRLITVRALEPASARGTEGDLRVSYPVEILGVKGIPALPSMVEVEARAMSPGDFPVVRVEDWPVEGRVAKADGSLKLRRWTGLLPALPNP